MEIRLSKLKDLLLTALDQIYYLGESVTEVVRRLNAVAIVYKSSNKIYYTSLYDLSVDDASDSIVELFGSTETGPLVLENGSSYQTNGRNTSFGTITDQGQSVTASLLGNSSFIASYSRKVVLSGSNSKVNVEADLFLSADDGSKSVSITNGSILMHTGLLGAFGGSNIGAEIKGSSKYYLNGTITAGGSLAISLEGASYAELNLTKQATYGFRRFSDVAENCELVIRGGVKLVNPTPYPIQYISDLKGIMRLKTGVYDCSSVTSFILGANASLYISSNATITSYVSRGYDISGAVGGKVYIHEGATVNLANIDPNLTIINLPSDAAISPVQGGNPVIEEMEFLYQGQIPNSTDRFFGLLINEPIAIEIDSLVNTNGLTGQVISISDNLGYGPQRSTVEEINTDIIEAFQLDPKPDVIELKFSYSNIINSNRTTFITLKLT